MFWALVISLFITILFSTQDALAWGPATHLEIGMRILHHADMLGPAIVGVIEKYRYDFLYGNISADIVVGKNFVEELKHCHNWRFGFRLLKEAKSAPQRAFSYGYLSHLAADTVAHNIFIPEMMVKSFSARILRHIYWELRFDALINKDVWRLPEKLVKKVHPECDLLLKKTLEGNTPLSFKTNKTIFSSLLTLQRMKRWHTMLDLLSSSSRWKLKRTDRERYLNLCMDVVIDILTHGRRAHCLNADPTGKKNLEQAKRFKKKLKDLKRSGRNWEPVMEDMLKDIVVR